MANDFADADIKIKENSGFLVGKEKQGVLINYIDQNNYDDEIKLKLKEKSELNEDDLKQYDVI